MVKLHNQKGEAKMNSGGTFSDSKVLKNQKGGKPSNVSVSVTLKKGEVHRVHWKWEVSIKVVRNERPFQCTNTTPMDDVKGLIEDLFTKVCNEIATAYCRGCNVDARPILAFVKASKKKCYKALEL